MQAFFTAFSAGCPSNSANSWACGKELTDIASECIVEPVLLDLFKSLCASREFAEEFTVLELSLFKYNFSSIHWTARGEWPWDICNKKC